MNEIEKRDLIEQQRKILEGGTQRADRRTGSFGFLTWPFFIAPLIASEEFLAASQKAGVGAEEDLKGHSASLSSHTANNDPTASELSKASAENETARESLVSSLGQAAQFDAPGSVSHSDQVPKLSAEHSEFVAVAIGGDAGHDDHDFCHHDTQTSIEDSSIISLSTDSSFDSGQGVSTAESLQSNGLSDLLNPSTVGSATPVIAVSSSGNNAIAASTPIEPTVQPVLATASDAVTTLAHDAVGTIAPVEAAVQPVLATASDAVTTLAHDAVGAISPVEAAVQPVLATASDAVTTLAHDAVGAISPVEAAVQPVLATASDAVTTLAHDAVGAISPVEAAVQPVLATAPDAVTTLAHDAVGAISPVEAAVQPVLATASDAVTTLAHDAVGAISPVEAAVQPVLATASDAVTTLAHDAVGTIAPVEAAVQPVLATASDAVTTLAHDAVGAISPVEAAVQPVLATASDAVTTLAHDAVGTIAPVEAAVQPVLATAADAVTTSAHDAVGAISPVEAAVQPVLATASDAVTTLAHDAVGAISPVEAAVQPVLATAADAVTTLAHDAVGTIAPVEAAVQPVLATAANSANVPIPDVSHTTDSGNVAGEALGNPVGITEAVLGSISQSDSVAATDPLHPAVADATDGYNPGAADTLLAPATTTDAPIELPGSAAVGSSDAITSGSNGSNVAVLGHPSAIAGDVIAFNDAPAPPADALFSGSQYTSYGVALTSDITDTSQHAAPSADTASAHDVVVAVVAAAEKQAVPPPDIVDATHSIDHLGHAML